MNADDLKKWEAVSPKVFGICISYLKNIHDAEDAKSEVFLRYFAYCRDNPDRPANITGWITVVAKNLCCDLLRSYHRRTDSVVSYHDELSVPEKTFDDGHRLTPEHILSARQDLEVLYQSLEKENPNNRQIFTDYLLGYRHHEIAARNGITEVSSRKRVQYIRERFIEHQHRHDRLETT